MRLLLIQVLQRLAGKGSERCDRDEAIAAQPTLAPLDLPPDALTQPMEAHQARLNQPQAIAGIVEHGVIRPLDPDAKLP
jgi:hypothetical protein